LIGKTELILEMPTADSYESGMTLKSIKGRM